MEEIILTEEELKEIENLEIDVEAGKGDEEDGQE